MKKDIRFNSQQLDAISAIIEYAERVSSGRKKAMLMQITLDSSSDGTIMWS